MNPPIENIKTKAMSMRNGAAARLIGVTFCIVVIVYLFYTNHTTTNRLKNEIDTKIRCTDAQKTLSTQLKDLMSAKAELETRHQSDKDAMLGKYNALSKDYQLMQTSKDELSQQYEDLKEKSLKEKREIDDAMRAQVDEITSLKRSHQTAIDNLKESINNMQRQKDKYLNDLKICENDIADLKTEREDLTKKLESIKSNLPSKENPQNARNAGHIRNQNLLDNVNAEKDSNRVVESNKDLLGKPNMPYRRGDSAKFLKPQDNIDKPNTLGDNRRGLAGDQNKLMRPRIDDSLDQIMGGGAKDKTANVENDHVVHRGQPGLNNPVHVDDDAAHHQIRPPGDNEEKRQGYKKKDSGAKEDSNRVAEFLKDEFHKEQQENAQIKMPQNIPDDNPDENDEKIGEIDENDNDKDDQFYGKDTKDENLHFNGKINNNILRPPNVDKEELAKQQEEQEQDEGQKMPLNPRHERYIEEDLENENQPPEVLNEDAVL